MKFPKENILNNWLEENQDPEIDNFIEKNLAIVNKVHLALKDKGWSKTRFAEEMGKRPSEISKWLTGMHNLTLKSITKMETVLGVDLINIEPVVEYKYVHLGIIKDESGNSEIKEEEYQESDHAYAM